MGTLWKAKIRFSVPMLFALGMYFNFLIGGISGVFLSDVPADTTEHGSFFVMAHFHYTIMGGLIFALMAGIYYWLPKMTGLRLNQRLGEDPVLDHVHLLQLRRSCRCSRSAWPASRGGSSSTRATCRR